jgi:iron complex outermembrane receptor protein
LERIEVLKGPSAALFGDASPGGVINLVTKKPLDEFRHNVAASYGSYNQLYGAVDSTGPITTDKELLYRVNVSGWDGESFRNQYFDKGFSIAPSLSWLPTASTRINVEAVYTDRQSIRDRGAPNIQGASRLGEVPIEVMYTQPGDNFDTLTTSFAVTVEQKLTDSWSVAGSYMHHRYEEDSTEHGFNSYITPSTVFLYYDRRFVEARTDSGTVYSTGRFDTGPVQHKLVLGVDAMKQTSHADDAYVDDVATFDLLDPQYFARPIGTYGPFIASEWGGTLRTTGLFVQDQLTFGPWDVLPGIRFTRYSNATIGADEEDDSAITPRLSVVYRFTDDLSAYATWLTGFQPNFGYTAINGGPFGPTDSQLFEVGHKQMAFDRKLLVTTALYHLTNNDIVVYANDTGNPDLYRQRGQEQAYGLELEAVGKLSERWSLISNYAYNHAEITKDEDPTLVGKKKENAPEHAATVWARYQIGGGFGIGAGIEYIGERETFVDTLTLEDYVLFNAALYYQWRTLNVALNGRNLTDETHWTGAYNYQRSFPGDPLTVTLSADYTF